ncbi:MAG TPA: hypothetical protein VHB74_11445 [Devosia sp.]|nr:hypothetical protein [Devosia sp.]
MSLARRFLFGALAALPAGLIARRAEAAVAADPVPKVAYHLADAEKIDFVLGNIENHFAGMGGPDRVHIALVVHGPALLGFEPGRANADRTRRLAALVAKGLDLGACGNTLKAQNLTVGQLLPGFAPVPEGGVVRLARLQAMGYAYLRP